MFCSPSLMIVNFFGCSLSWKAFIFLTVLKDKFAGYINRGSWLFTFKICKILLQSLVLVRIFENKIVLPDFLICILEMGFIM